MNVKETESKEERRKAYKRGREHTIAVSFPPEVAIRWNVLQEKAGSSRAIVEKVPI